MSVFEELNRIKWAEKGHADYTIHCYDRLEKRLNKLPFTRIKEIGKSFMVVETEGKKVDMPLHRVREIRKKGKLIWNR